MPTSDTRLGRTTVSNNAEAEYDRLLAEERLILAATELVVEAMDRQGVTRKDLAARLGVTAGEITQRLSGTRNLTLRSFAAMLHALDAAATVAIEYRDTDGATDHLDQVQVLQGITTVPDLEWLEPAVRISVNDALADNYSRADLSLAA